MAYNAEKIFAALGKGIKKFNMIRSTLKPYLETVQTEWIPLLNDTNGERRLLNVVAALNASDQSQLDGMQDTVKAALEDFMKDEIRLDLSIVQGTLNKVIDALVDAMQDATDTVLEDTFDAVEVTYDNDNDGDGTLSAPALTQQAHDDVNVELECYDITTTGSEKWYVRLSFRSGTSIYLGIATTAVEFDTADLYAAGSIPIDWGFSFTVGVGLPAWAVGDKIYFSTSIDAPGKFQYFFVNELHRALPSDSTPSETIDEDWAT